MGSVSEEDRIAWRMAWNDMGKAVDDYERRCRYMRVATSGLPLDSILELIDKIQLDQNITLEYIKKIDRDAFRFRMHMLLAYLGVSALAIYLALT